MLKKTLTTLTTLTTQKTIRPGVPPSGTPSLRAATFRPKTAEKIAGVTGVGASSVTEGINDLSKLPFYLTEREVAALFRVRVATIQRWRKADQAPPSVRVKGRFLYPSADLIAWIEDEDSYVSGGSAA